MLLNISLRLPTRFDMIFKIWNYEKVKSAIGYLQGGFNHTS